MNDTIEMRQVKRWFYKGKSYGSRLRAYKVKAKEELYDLVLGVPYNDEENGHVGTERSKLVGVADARAEIGRLMQEFGFQCEEGGNDREGEPVFPCCPESFAFCGKKYHAWIRNRAFELMKDADND